MAEPVYSDWKPSINADNEKETGYCPYCEEWSAQVMVRYVTNRDGETEKQYRVTCPYCNHTGKTYLHKNVAMMSWDARENDPEPLPPPKKKRRYY